MLTEESPLQHY